jgi:hypothetical protein
MMCPRGAGSIFIRARARAQAQARVELEHFHPPRLAEIGHALVGWGEIDHARPVPVPVPVPEKIFAQCEDSHR